MARTVGTGLALWLGTVVVASVDGVVAKLSGAELAALGVFALIFAPAMCLADRELRAWLGEIAWLATAAAALDGFVILMSVIAAIALEPWPHLVGTPAFAIAAFVAAPLAVALNAILIGRALARRRSGDLLRGDLARARP